MTTNEGLGSFYKYTFELTMIYSPWQIWIDITTRHMIYIVIVNKHNRCKQQWWQLLSACGSNVIPSWSIFQRKCRTLCPNATGPRLTGPANAQLPGCPLPHLLDILLEYWIEHVTLGLLYVMFTLPTRILYRGVPGIVTDCPCGVWCRGLTTCLLYVGRIFGNLV